MSGIPKGVYVTAGIAFGYYFFSYKPALIQHDAALAKEYCPKFVINFNKCRKGDIAKCEREMLELHDCIHRFKGINQEDKNFL